MRWPIRIQLLLPMLSVVVLAIVLATAAVAYWRGAQKRAQQEEDMERMVATLTDATFPLTQKVLQQLSGLSGAEFVMLDSNGRVQNATLRFGEGELDLLGRVRAARQGDRFSASPVISLGGETYFSDRVPVPRPRSTVRAGSLIMLYPVDRWWATIRRATYPALTSGAIVTVVVVLLTTVLAQRFVRPIKQLGDQAAAIAGGDFSSVAIPRRDDEIRDLAVSINQMTEKLSRYENEVRRSERLRTLGQLGAGMAHQLRNSAAGASMAIELHRQECPISADSEALEVAWRQLRLTKSYVQRFLTLGRSQLVRHERVSLQSLAEDVLGLVRPACAHAKIDLSLRKPAQPIDVQGEPESLGQLLINLVQNAIEAVGRQGDAAARVLVELDTVGADRAVLRVKDSGPGPAAATKEQLFEPFVSEKPDGTGLGLFVARQITEAHRGSIRWERRDGMTCFTVELPTMPLVARIEETSSRSCVARS